MLLQPRGPRLRSLPAGDVIGGDVRGGGLPEPGLSEAAAWTPAARTPVPSKPATAWALSLARCCGKFPTVGSSGPTVSRRLPPVTLPDVLWLDDPLCRDPSIVGNKCASLAQLRGRDYTVPDGFCVTIPALAGVAASWQAAVTEAVRRLPPPWVARSSSTAEDSEGLAFPGLFTTVLDLPDAPSLIEAITTVRASLDAAAVAVYACTNHVDPDAVRMAVLVQGLIPATSAGVAFSRHPRTGATQVVVEANYGIGETVVDGSVTPDSATINADGEIIDRRVGSKKEKLVATTSRARIRRLPTSELDRRATVLSDHQILRIARLARRLEQDMRRPIDMEWAYEADELWVLQCRPITALPSANPDRPSEDT